MLARVLAFFPAWFSGRIEPRAHREVRSWTRHNTTLRVLQYGRLRRLLNWSTDHPIVFALGAAVAAACIAYAITGQSWIGRWRLSSPKVAGDFDVVAFAGVPWTVQATLVALVYPIVLSFIALMLQRKAHSSVALRVYVLDSAVVPAGASSVGLLVAMGAQYFATPYSSPDLLEKYLAPLLVWNGAWLLMNVLLTGFFLSRTIRFIQEEEQRHAFTRIAVAVALRSELVAAVKQHIFVRAAESEWGFPPIGVREDSQPQVIMFSLGSERPQVKLDLQGSAVLHDVHLRLLKVVAMRWHRRATIAVSAGKKRQPRLIFPCAVGEVGSGEVVLCSVQNGPSLTRLERLLVRMAFVFRPSREGTLSLSSRKMLAEIGSEVEAAAELQRFGNAQERLRDMQRLHISLLLASAGDSEGVAINAATMGTSPYAWGDSTFGKEWLKPYWDIARIAVNGLDKDARLFDAVASIPANIADELPPRPEKLLIDVQEVAMALSHQLSGWWTSKADASLLPGATTFSGTLPAPLSKVYEQAVTAFIGRWGRIRVHVPEEAKGDEEQYWQALVGRALVYAAHIENSALLFLRTVSRGDEAGAIWFLENLLKWWGTRQFELDIEDAEYQLSPKNITLALTAKEWPAAQEFLRGGPEPITIQIGQQALSLAVRAYWESMRLYAVLLLVHNVDLEHPDASRELRYAAALVTGTEQRPGGMIEIQPIDSVDALLCSTLEQIFSVESTMRRLDHFAESLRSDDELPVVSGWVYSWSGTQSNFESLKRELAITLVSLASGQSSSVPQSTALIQRWWSAIDKLDAVVQYCAEVRRIVLSGSFVDAHGAVSSLQKRLGRTSRVRSARLEVALALKKLSAAAIRERRLFLGSQSVDQAKVRELGAHIAAFVFDGSKLLRPIREIRFIAGMQAGHVRVTFEGRKRHYLEGVEAVLDTRQAEAIGNWARRYLEALSFHRKVTELGLKPLNSAALRSGAKASHTEMQTYLAAVARECSASRDRGEEPLILVGRSAAGRLLRPSKWGAGSWQCPIPAGIEISEERDEGTVQMRALINGVRVFDFETPNGDCYVVPAAAVATLGVSGADGRSALSISFSEESEDSLKFTVSCRAAFI